MVDIVVASVVDFVVVDFVVVDVVDSVGDSVVGGGSVFDAISVVVSSSSDSVVELVIDTVVD